MDDAALLESLIADVALVTEVLLHDDAARVQHCPGWALRDLVAHHGAVLRWATAIVRTGEFVAADFPAPGGGASELAGWYADGAKAFVDEASSAGRSRACWTFGRPPAEAWFWTRRQALEAAIHRWDAELAVGHPTALTQHLASAGITEVLDDLFPRQIALGRSAELSAPVLLRSTDTAEEWLIAGSGESTHAAATIEASGSALLLLLWRRVHLNDSEITITGASPSLVQELQATRFAP